jgi:hypothetical protein
MSLEERRFLKEISAAYQAMINAQVVFIGMNADMNQERRNNYNNKVETAVEAGDTAVQMADQMDAPRVKDAILLAQDKTLEMRKLFYDAMGEDEDKMKELLVEAAATAKGAEQEWGKATDMLKKIMKEQMGGRGRSKRRHKRTLRSKRNRTHRTHRTHRK